MFQSGDLRLQIKKISHKFKRCCRAIFFLNIPYGVNHKNVLLSSVWKTGILTVRTSNFFSNGQERTMKRNLFAFSSTFSAYLMLSHLRRNDFEQQVECKCSKYVCIRAIVCGCFYVWWLMFEIRNRNFDQSNQLRSQLYYNKFFVRF